MRVLVVKMSSLGDVIHTLPALTDAARAVREIRFDWVVEEAFAEVPSWHPAVDRVIPVAIRRWRERPLRDFSGPEWRRARARLRQHRYDAVIDAQGLLKSAVIAALVKAPRHGMDRHSAREGLASLAYHHRVAVPRDMHAVERTRLLFARALDYTPPVEMGDYGLSLELPEGGGGSSPGLLFLHGSARAEKLWPEDHWVDLAQLAGQQGCKVWLPWGSPPERQRAERIAGCCANAAVLPQQNLIGLARALSRVDAVVAVDTGPAHLGAALDVPTVSLYGPTSTRLVGAYGRNQVHIQSPLGVRDSDNPHAMMQSIEPTAVWRELQAILAGRC